MLNNSLHGTYGFYNITEFECNMSRTLLQELCYNYFELYFKWTISFYSGDSALWRNICMRPIFSSYNSIERKTKKNENPERWYRHRRCRRRVFCQLSTIVPWFSPKKKKMVGLDFAGNHRRRFFCFCSTLPGMTSILLLFRPGVPRRCEPADEM